MRNTKSLQKRIEKAGICASKKEGRLVSEEELKRLRIQIVPNSVRGTSWALACVAGYLSYLCFSSGKEFWGGVFVVLGVLFILFAIFGIKRTLSSILDNFDAIEATELSVKAIISVSKRVGHFVDNIDLSP